MLETIGGYHGRPDAGGRDLEAASGGPHPDRADFDGAMAENRRLLLSITVDERYGFNV